MDVKLWVIWSFTIEKCNFDKRINYIRPECVKGEFIKITLNSLVFHQFGIRICNPLPVNGSK